MNGTSLSEIIDRVGIIYALLLILIVLMYIAFYRKPKPSEKES